MFIQCTFPMLIHLHLVAELFYKKFSLLQLLTYKTLYKADQFMCGLVICKHGKGYGHT